MNIKEIIDIAKKDELVFDSVDKFDDVVNGKITLDEYNNSFKISKLRLLWNIFITPVLIIHELTHIVFGLLVGKKINDVSFSKINQVNYHASVDFETLVETNILTTILVNLSPVLVWLISILLTFVNPLFSILLIYVVITYKYSLPSKVDLLKVILFKYRKEFDNDEQYITFGSYCIKYKLKDIL